MLMQYASVCPYSRRREKCSPPIRLTGCEEVLPINLVPFLVFADSESREVAAKQNRQNIIRDFG